LNSGLLLPDRRRRITLLLKNIEGQTRPRSKSSLFKLKSLPLRLQEKPMSLRGKLQKPKLLKSSLTKPQRNLNDFTEKDINSISSGKKLSRIQEREMS
jgi:hypothetical protein